MPSQRLFFALHPDAQEAGRVDRLAHALRERLALRGKPLGAARYHLTVHFIGSFAPAVPPARIEAALAQAAPLAARTPPLAVRLDALQSFARARNLPLVLRGDAAAMPNLAALAAGLARAAADAGGVPAPSRPYVPHLTLLYDDQRVPLQPVEPPLAWTSRELLLMRSWVGQGRHELLARLPLAGAPSA